MQDNESYLIIRTGTWVPIERGLALSKQFNVEDLLRPIIDYVPTAVSPPPAPKHIVAPPTKKKKDPLMGPATSSTPAPKLSVSLSQTQQQQAAAAQRKQAAVAAQAQAQAQAHAQAMAQQALPSTPDDRERSGDESMTDSPSASSSASATPSPIESVAGSDPGLKRKFNPEPGAFLDQQPSAQRPRIDGVPVENPDVYTDIILNYFITETTTIPSILVNPPADYDPNTRIDDDGHTALHWACAMGRVRVVKLLLSAGANIFFVNNAEQTPLMRSVMFSNNYDVRKFPELYELLHRSTLNIDKSNRTVFHHIADVALSKGKTHAARYYMETILSRLADYPQELADVINFQDEDGETALTLAARARSKRLVKALLDHGADPKVQNRDGKSAEDYILEDERFRSSPIHRTGANPIASSSTAPQLYHSVAAQAAGGKCIADATSHFETLAKAFESELQGKERDIVQANALAVHVEAEDTEAQRQIIQLRSQVHALHEKRARVAELEQSLRDQVRDGFRRGYEVWLAGEQGREERWRAGGSGEDYNDLEALLDLSGAEDSAEEDRLRWEVQQQREQREHALEHYVRAQAEVGCPALARATLTMQAGTGEKMASYRRLIAAACGGVPLNEVDGYVANLLEVCLIAHTPAIN